MTLPYYPFYWGDYSKKTPHLNQAQHGAYLLLLRYVYMTGQPIYHKSRYTVALATTRAERDNADYVLQSFFVPKGDYWHSPKAEEVIANAEVAHEKRVRAGRAGGRTKASNAQAKPKQSSSNATSPASSNAQATTEQESCQEGDYSSDGQSAGLGGRHA